MLFLVENGVWVYRIKQLCKKNEETQAATYKVIFQKP